MHTVRHTHTHTYLRILILLTQNKIFEADNKLNTSKTMTNNKAVIKSIGQKD